MYGMCTRKVQLLFTNSETKLFNSMNSDIKKTS